MQTSKKRSADAPRQALLLSNHLHIGRATNTQILAQTPASNTGLDSQPEFSVAVDWLDITFRSVLSLSVVEEILSEVESLFEDTIEFSSTRAIFSSKKWQGSGESLKGSRIYYDAGSKRDNGTDRSPALKIILPGGVIGPSNQSAVACWLMGRAQENELDCTRIDIALDDHKRRASLDDITDARAAGNFFNVNETSYSESGKRGEAVGKTVYFGSTKSDRRLCIYDKTVESKGRIKGIRWEARFRRKAARAMIYEWAEKMATDTRAAASFCVDTVTGVVDFRNRDGGDPNRARCPRLQWFGKFVDRLRANPCRVRCSQPVQTLQKTIAWIGRSVAPSLALLSRVLDTDFDTYLSEVVREGGAKISNAKRRLADATLKESLVY